jgi:SAM-dependent methyltransferase
MSELERRIGREAFGADPAGYHAARPGYPELVWEVLVDRCGLAAGTPTFEVGPGTGLATERLLELGADPLVAVEPDERLARYLASAHPQARVLGAPFETADLAERAFRLGCSATAFHWVDPAIGLPKVARLLEPGGWWAMWWNIFGDPFRKDPFHEATLELLRGARSPGNGTVGGLSYGDDREARAAEMRATGRFANLGYEQVTWTLVLDPPGVRALYATYSEMAARPAAEREALLDRLERIAAEEFGGRVERNMVTAIHTAQRL